MVEDTKLTIDQWKANADPKQKLTEKEADAILALTTVAIVSGTEQMVSLFNETTPYTLKELFSSLAKEWRIASAEFQYDPSLFRPWINNDFDRDQTKKWINVGVKVNQSDFAKWLRDERRSNPQMVSQLSALQPRYLETLHDNYLGIASAEGSDIEKRFYEGIAKIFNEHIRKEVDDDKKSDAQIAFEKDEKLRKEFDNLKKGREGKGSIIPFWFGREIEKFELDPNTKELKPKYKPNTGYEVKDFESYKRYLDDLEAITTSDYDFPPYVFPNGKEIWTFEQFKTVILTTRPKDFLRGKKLTYLATFVERYFKEEAMGQLRKHLVELFSLMVVDLKLNQPKFWDKIKRFVEKEDMPPPVPDLPKDVREAVQRLDDFIEFCYGGYPEPLDRRGYLAARRAIVADYETLMMDLWKKYVNNPTLFILNRGYKLTTVV